LNQTQQMSATGFFSDGSSRDVTTSAKWASSDPKTVSVNATGLVTANQVGQATISATLGNAQGQTTVTSNQQIA